MKANRLVFMISLLSGAALFQLTAQQTKPEQKPVKEVMAKAKAAAKKAKPNPRNITPVLKTVWASATRRAKAYPEIWSKR